MSKAVEWLVDDLIEHGDVSGILLAGIGKSSAKVVVIVHRRREYYRRGQAMKGIWVEQYCDTFERLMKAVKSKGEAYIRILRSGDILYDPEGHLSELTRLAKRTDLQYRKPQNKRGMWQGLFRNLVEYNRVPDERMREHVIDILKQEWGKSPTYMMEAQWDAQWVDLNELKSDIGVLSSEIFIKEIEERVIFQQKKIWNDEPIEPIIAVRNELMWLIDGYARAFALTRVGLNEVMAYVGKLKGFMGP